MALGYDARLKKEIRRRDTGILQMKLAGDATSNIVSQKVDEMKTDLRTQLDPKRIIAEHPWPSLLIGMAAGAISVLLMKSKLFRAPKQQQVTLTGTAPQKVVIEVVGAGQKSDASGWKSIFDAVMTGAPAALAYAQQFMSSAEVNGHAAPEIPGNEQPAPAVSASPASSTAKTSGGTSFPASISRRTAPPPRES